MQCKFIAGAALVACIAAPASLVSPKSTSPPSSRSRDGAAYGATGAYERVRGTFKGELDPADARNKVIVNLDKAPRNARGLVEYEADFFLLRPADAARGNHKIIYDVTNRGRKFIHARLMDAKPASVAATNDPRTADDAGNGLFFRMGYTLAWSGWDSEAPRSEQRHGDEARDRDRQRQADRARDPRRARQRHALARRSAETRRGAEEADPEAVVRSGHARPEPGEAHRAPRRNRPARGNSGVGLGLRGRARDRAAARRHASRNPARSTNSTIRRKIRACSASAWRRRAT